MTDDGREVGAGSGRPWLARCPGCGYDLSKTDLDARPCPECGWQATPEEIAKLSGHWKLEHEGAWHGYAALALIAGYFGVVELLLRARQGGDAIDLISGLIRAEFVLAIGVALGFGSSRLSPRGERRASFVIWCQTLVWLLLPLLVTFPLMSILRGPSIQLVPVVGVLLAMIGFGVWVWHAVWLIGRHVVELGAGAYAFLPSALAVVAMSLWPAAQAQMAIWASV